MLECECECVCVMRISGGCSHVSSVLFLLRAVERSLWGFFMRNTQKIERFLLHIHVHCDETMYIYLIRDHVGEDST